MDSYLRNIDGRPQPNILELYLSQAIPDVNLVSAVFVYAFNKDGELLMIHEHRGTYDLPGGQREVGESIEETAKREVMEEASVEIDHITPFAFQQLTVMEGEKPKGYNRPFPVSYEVFVCADVVGENPFKATEEAVGRHYFMLDEAVQHDGIQYGFRRQILEHLLLCLNHADDEG